MRALVCKQYGPPEDLCIETMDDPVPGDSDVVIDVAAAGINFPDMLIIAGQYQVKTPLPFVPGNEAAGIVSTVGARVENVAVGDRVAAYTTGGAFAEKFCVPAATVMPLPAALDFAQGAGLMVTYGTSYHALKQCADIKAGETLVVLGAAGGVGAAAVEIGKAMGARVIAAASSAEKLAFAAECGADAGVNYSREPLKERIKELTDGRGADVVYDPVGGELAEQALRATAWHGRYLVVGFASGTIPSFAANLALLKEASIVGVWWGTWVAKNTTLNLQNVAEIADLIEKGMLTPRITESHPLEDYLQAFDAIRSRRARGKVVLTMP